MRQRKVFSFILITVLSSVFGSACASIEPLEDGETGGSNPETGGSNAGGSSSGGLGNSTGGLSSAGGLGSVGGGSNNAGGGPATGAGGSGNSAACPTIAPMTNGPCTPASGVGGAMGQPGAALTCTYGTNRCLCRPLTSMWLCMPVAGAGGGGG